MTATGSLNKKGFTLIELLIIIGIIGFLAAAILVAVDPVKRLGDAQDAKRLSEANAILSAFLTKQLDEKAYYGGETGGLIVNHATRSQVIVRTSPAAGACDAPLTKPLCPPVDVTGAGVTCVANLSGLVPGFIAELPLDPKTSAPATGPAIGANNTGYYIHRVTNGGRIEIGSCWPYAGTISVKR